MLNHSPSRWKFARWIAAAAISMLNAAGAPGEPEAPLDTARRIADRLVAETKFSLVHPSTGERFADRVSLPSTLDYRVQSILNEWHYGIGVLHLGLIELAGATGEAGYRRFVTDNYAFTFRHRDYFSRQHQAGTAALGVKRFFRAEMLDDFGTMAAGMVALGAGDPDHDRYVAESVARILASSASTDSVATRNHLTRLDDAPGVLARHIPQSKTVWLDDLYMSSALLARVAARDQDDRIFDFITSQSVGFHQLLSDSTTGLYYHYYYADQKTPGVARWARANGWGLLANSDILAALPLSHPKRAEMLAIHTAHLRALARYQDVSGLWHQLLDRPDSYLETSASAMFTYAIARAVNRGWIAPRYGAVAHQGWKGVLARVRADGQVDGICIGTSVADYVEYYLARPTRTNDIRGVGAVILAAVEMAKLPPLEPVR